MDGFLNKLDTELQVIYAHYLDSQEKVGGPQSRVHPLVGRPGRFSVLMYHKGNLQSIEELGFKTTSKKDETCVQGTLLLKDLKNIASHEDVISLSVGKAGREMLDTSVSQINAGGSGNVWQVNTSNGNFTGSTGDGVVVGIIDTGIDWSHPVFWSSDSPITTRIKRIWDPGIDPHGSAQSPQANYMEGSERYGVEYTDTMINEVLRGNADSSTVKHKDCSGHGTHVASIAAGNGRAPKPGESNSAYKYIGVAPEADIVVVKILYLFNDVVETVPPPGEPHGTYILYDQMFKDAVTYIRKVAELDLGNKPVVINYSVGSDIAPHDGFTEQEKWLTQLFSASNSKGLFCAAAGNSRTDSIHAIVDIPAPTGGGANGEVSVPFNLFDNRNSTKRYFKRCKYEDETSNLYIGMWYRQPTAGAVTPHLTLPGKSEAGGLAVSSTIQHGYYGNNNQFHHTFIHSSATYTKPATGGNPATSITRNQIYLEVTPSRNGVLKQGQYNIRITGPPGTIIHIWVYKSRSTHPPHKEYGFSYPLATINGLTVEKSPNERNLIGEPAGANNILTVAAYNDINDTLAFFSSPGPLVDYAPLPAPQPHIAKPDIAAPGWGIIAADSSHTVPPASSPCLSSDAPPNYTSKSGTSMASPHIAGVAALLLEQNNSLTTHDLIRLIKTHVQSGGGSLPADDWGTGKVDAKNASDNIAVP